MTNSSRVYLNQFVERAAASVPSGSLILDAGAGNSIHRRHFTNHRYESADFAKVDKPYAPDLTYVCDLSSIPVEDDRYDLVVLTQVLEHLPEPQKVLVEMRRVLKPGASIWASCPLFYEEHEQPYDFYRYTQFSLRWQFEQAGFATPELDWLEGYLMTVGYELEVAERALPRKVWTAPFRAGLRAACEGFARADLRRKITSVGHPKNYTVVATA